MQLIVPCKEDAFFVEWPCKEEVDVVKKIQNMRGRIKIPKGKMFPKNQINIFNFINYRYYIIFIYFIFNMRGLFYCRIYTFFHGQTIKLWGGTIKN